jgi:hypothetical protein
MGVLTALRATLADDLAVLGIPVYAAWPTDLGVTCAFVAPTTTGEYVTSGPNFGEWTALVDVVILAEHAPADEALASLEDLLETALINTADWRLRYCEPIGPITVTEEGSPYLGVVIHLARPFTL